MKKKKTFQERKYSVSESEMQELVLQSKSGDGSAQLKLLEVFENFLAPYINFLYYGKYDLQNYNMRRFLALFVKDKYTRSYLMRNKLNAGGIKQLNEVVRGITMMCQRYGSLEDIEQTANLAFLECVNIYTPRESESGPVPFSGYLYAYYFYVLKKKVDALLIDQLGRKTFPLIDFDDIDEKDDHPPGFIAPPVASAEDMAGRFDIDEDWVVGDTATGVFAILSPQERQLLKWRFYNNERSSDIAQRISQHSNTTREAIAKIREKIRKYMEEQEKT